MYTTSIAHLGISAYSTKQAILLIFWALFKKKIVIFWSIIGGLLIRRKNLKCLKKKGIQILEIKTQISQYARFLAFINKKHRLRL